eukprot:NODE_4378_length_1899_cov_7.276524.p1 GENE.NODE_4378_length_1899_cov_7.276524~~NODE_4378_length_1899_cov_7.276524.p1  ORF type:complete len:552 (-),score=154.62 NODE_4378_length_1899_cov_7.276524:244-1677(-)
MLQAAVVARAAMGVRWHWHAFASMGDAAARTRLKAEAISSPTPPPPAAAEAAGTAPPRPTRWPLWAGGAAVLGLLAAAVALQDDDVVRLSLLSLAELEPAYEEPSRFHLGLVVIRVYMLLRLPITELRLALLRCGVIPFWLRVGRELQLDSVMILETLSQLLEGDAEHAAFCSDIEPYYHVVSLLLSMMRASDVTCTFCTFPEHSDHLAEALHLAATTAAHPCFFDEVGDDRLWEGLLHSGAYALEETPRAALPWSCIAAAVSLRPALAQAMMLHTVVKEQLLQVAQGDDARVIDPRASAYERELQTEYARTALHRLAKVAEFVEGAEDVLVGDRHLAVFLAYEPPELLPRLPPLRAADEDRVAAAAWSAVGGATWGLLRGLRGGRWRSALVTSAAAVTFEALMQLKCTVRDRLCGIEEAGPQLYASLSGTAAVYSLDIALSSLLLTFILQPARAPFAFGGCVLGRISYAMFTSDDE